MRDKIAQIISDKYQYGGESLAVTADAIIAALPGMVEPLVWGYPRDFPYAIAYTQLGVYSIASDEDSPSRMLLDFSLTDDASFTRWSVELEEGCFEPEELEQKANAHHVAQVMKSFGAHKEVTN